ncbi:MAG: threonine-phosphate decarboxylase [Alcanivorax sp.]|nr:MAG: threonine-phosphate decarboxylase [Alcanivorax sp.]
MERVEPMNNLQPPHHGGRLQAAARQFKIPVNDWLDLSTGINPFSWQPPPIPQSVWQCLPDTYDGLEQAAHRFYGAPMMAIPGSQWAIQTLPAVIPSNRVWLPREAYEEHRFWWQYHQHDVRTYAALDAIEPAFRDVVVVVNPNNPTAEFESSATLLQMAHRLLAQDGHMIIDEAFMDCTPEQSVFHGNKTLPENLIVLRSLGKFFGLAGLRLGFLFGADSLQSQLKQKLGPWAVSHPAAYVGELALLDSHWQQQTRRTLQQASTELQGLLARHVPPTQIQATNLFCTLDLRSEMAVSLHRHCARQGILLRHFEHWHRIRVGLTTKTGRQRLEMALQCWNF